MRGLVPNVFDGHIKYTFHSNFVFEVVMSTRFQTQRTLDLQNDTILRFFHSLRLIYTSMDFNLNVPFEFIVLTSQGISHRHTHTITIPENHLPSARNQQEIPSVCHYVNIKLLLWSFK